MHLTHIATAALAAASFNLAHGFPNPYHAWSTSQSENSLTYAIGHGFDAPIHDQLILSKRALTQDNTCGVTRNGQNGWICDSQAPFGGACCSIWVSCMLRDPSNQFH
jgi:hemolysin-activating ACP:hemolysin acyltransferase